VSQNTSLILTVADSLRDLAQQLEQFTSDRDWSQFHSPKNLASALVVEAGELLEHFQWLTEAQSRGLSPEKRAAAGAELADVLLYLVQLAGALHIDLIQAARTKLAANALKYPIERARGTSKKYNDL
jgi:NTP pyrophosphatase (non-canonical NTP hydrolase)